MIDKIYKTKAAEWEKIRVKKSLALFKAAAIHVPAYKKFLKSNGVNSTTVKTWKDFLRVPLVSRSNYLWKYPLESLCWGGTLKQSIVFTSTSGSTGAPFYFPRNIVLDGQSALMHEYFLKNDITSSSRTTLVVDCFGMGVWIGGLLTYSAFNQLSTRGYPLSILTPGINKKEIFEGIRNLKNKYDQIIICGYPPFIKDLVDEFKNEDINLNSNKVRLIFAAEGFSEKFREYVASKIGIKNLFCDTMNIYGSADLGTMAIETPISILLRRLAVKNGNFQRQLFTRTGRLPTLAQFNPSFINFEEVNGQLVCTGDSVLPLVRYSIGDNGGVIKYDDAEKLLSKNGFGSCQHELKRAGLNIAPDQLPYVYVYERDDLSTKLYGAIMYPEHIKEALHHNILMKNLTGRFTMITKTDKKQNQYLEINLELKRGEHEKRSLEASAKKIIGKTLLEMNAEHKNNVSSMPSLAEPHLVFWNYENPIHFGSSGKQKWVKK